MFAISTAVVVADEPPRPQGIPWPTTMPWPTARPLGVGETWSPWVSVPVATPVPAMRSESIPVIVLPANPVPAPAPVVVGGTSPSSPLNPTGNWDILGAGGTVWYRIGSGGVQMSVFLDAEPLGNVTLAVYAPGQLHRPIGYGTPYHKDTARLAWAGGHWRAQGDWLAKITNSNPIPIRYRISSSVNDISNKTCYSYWEYIGPNYVYWTECR